MNKEFEKAVADYKKIGLTSQEKKEMLARILGEPGAIPTDPQFILNNQQRRRFFVLPNDFAKKYLSATLIILLVLLSGSGTVLAAEKSLPGEALYAVKVAINEPFLDALAISPETKARREALKAERRLSEAEELAARGILSSEQAEELLERFDAHADKFERAFANAKERVARDAGKARTETLTLFHAALNAHERIIANLLDRIPEPQKAHVLVIQKAVVEKKEEAEKEHKTESPDASSDISEKKKVMEKKINAAKKEFREIQSESGIVTDLKTAAEISLIDSVRAYNEAVTDANAGKSEEAKERFTDSLRSATETELISKFVKKISDSEKKKEKKEKN